MESIQAWVGPGETAFRLHVAQVAWQCLRDSLPTDLSLKYRPQEIAISIIYFVSMCYGVEVTHNEKAGIKWWQVGRLTQARQKLDDVF